MNITLSIAEQSACDAASAAYFVEIASAQRQGLGCLPQNLGLKADDFARLRQSYSELDALAAPSWQVLENSQLRAELLNLRAQEWAELVELLELYARAENAAWMARIVAAACMGSKHLWRDLGLRSRARLRELIGHFFPDLLALNDKDMRWKKFFYKQLCARQGHFLCRSPSCETCSSYDECFGEEI